MNAPPQEPAAASVTFSEAATAHRALPFDVSRAAGHVLLLRTESIAARAITRQLEVYVIDNGTPPIAHRPGPVRSSVCDARAHESSMDRVTQQGDMLKEGGVTSRLWGIDAPEAKQVCPDGWPAGSLATTRLQALTSGRSIVCQEKDRDRYGRIVAICRASGEDLGAILVREGFAWAFTRFSVDYVDQREEARIANRGVLGHDCVPAWGWRAQQRARTAAP